MVQGTRTCTVDGCSQASTKRGMCEPHYRAHIRSQRGPCSVDECDITWQVAGLCLKHYHRKRRWGTTDDPEPTPPLSACSVDGCDDTVKSRGLCSKHYARDQRAKYGTCNIDGCENQATNRRGWCANHYYRMLKFGSPEHEPPSRRRQSLVCAVPDCNQPTRARGWCATHWKRWRTHGSTDLPEPPMEFFCRGCQLWKLRSELNPTWGRCEQCSRKRAQKQKQFHAYRAFAHLIEGQRLAQNYRCAICGIHQGGVKRGLVIDHCHKTLVFRGLLCNNCNHGLGQFKDDPKRLEAAAAYLRQTPPKDSAQAALALELPRGSE